MFCKFQAPLSVQKAAGCIIGKDYPKPIVDHDSARTENIARMKRVFEIQKKAADDASEKSSPSSK